ncbi:asparaginase [Limnobacter thiooxidans]|uniref:Asparaginase n=1 Tax=Limnobacter thiooxidans TaxID=131080 RepID=A0AA86J1T2_9BURK|nr:asparaginase [Limnobacter thiooxidans]BET25996.1 asparaginase [Limnobacter thiooxidans]
MMTNSSLQILDPLPRLAFVSTGGTIAGTLVENSDHWKYQSAQRSGQSLLMGVPGLLRRAQWFFEQPYSIGSQNLELSHMLQLRALILHLLGSTDVDGILITHGTDTMEDMLYFLHLTLPSGSVTKPILFTAAMLPSDHPQADGPDNLNCAVDLLCQTLSSHKLNNHKAENPFGLVMQGLYTPAAAVEKRTTSGLDAFDGAFSVKADIDWPVALDQPELVARFGKQGDFASLFNADTISLPLFEALEVPVVYCVPGNGPIRQLNDLLGRKPASVIVAAPGHGNIPDACVPVLRRLMLNGVSVVRASRVAEGGVEQGGEFDALDEFRANAIAGQASKGSKHAGVFSEAGQLSLSKCVMRERLRVLAHSLSC